MRRLIAFQLFGLACAAVWWFEPQGGLTLAYPLLPVLAIAASAAGTGMQMAGAAKSRRAMESATAAERKRQKQFEEQATALYERSKGQNTVEQAEADLASGEAGRTEAYERLAAIPMAGATAATVPQGGNVTQQRDSAAQRAAATAFNRAVGGSQAKLGSYGDWGTQQGIRMADANKNLGIVSGNSRRSAGILQSEMVNAQHEGDTLSGFGSILGAIGSVAGMASATTPANPYPGLTTGSIARPPW